MPSTLLCPMWVHHSLRHEHFQALRLEALREHRIAPLFHYQSVQQSTLWLDVFRKNCPAFTSAQTASIYSQLAESLVALLPPQPTQLISLGCGEGSKDLLVLTALVRTGEELVWVPQDISASLILLASQKASDLPLPLRGLFPLLGDLGAMADLNACLLELPKAEETSHPPRRLFTFFGLAPNLEPQTMISLWKSFLGPGDQMLLSANLAPIQEETPEAYRAGVEAIRPQYDNPETQKWLSAIITDWGWSELLENYSMEPEFQEGLWRMSARMRWKQGSVLHWENQNFNLVKNQELELFFSIRYTPARFRVLLEKAGLVIRQEILSPCKQEGVWWVEMPSTARFPN